MHDADAREYAIAALEGFATELDALNDDTGPSFDLDGFIGRMRTVAGRLQGERDFDDSDPVDVVRRAIFVVADRQANHGARLLELGTQLLELEMTIAAIGTRVLGGPPAAGFVPVDGEELERGA